MRGDGPFQFARDAPAREAGARFQSQGLPGETINHAEHTKPLPGVTRAVADSGLRTRLGIPTWQEIAVTLPKPVRLIAQQCVDVTSEASVRAILNDLKSGLYISIGNKQLERLGDQAALAAICVNTLDDINQEKTATAIASMISLSFAHPEMIVNAEDRVPKASQILLAYLQTIIRTPQNRATLRAASAAVERESELLKRHNATPATSNQ